ncbi:MAG: hypothetical protein HC840_00330 [Leptolyngbyaceae cyanobacterium RM2_2_4]|nr:hypothetical protein [Leptolyngbyaceae cyanobacterium RM2_2_4]
MAALRKIIKNISGSTRQILNRSLAHNESYEIPYSQWMKAGDSELLAADITAGLVQVSDGTNTYSAAAGVAYLKKFEIINASDVPFSNSGNGFTAINAQEAIEEAKTTSILKPRFSIVTVFNGTIGNNNWLGYSELVPGDQVPIRIPLNSKLKEITVAYKNTNLLEIPTGSNLIDGRLQVFKNGLTDPTNIVHTETFTNQANGKVITGLNISFATGDYLVSRWKDDGDNPSDMAIVYFFQVE